MLACLSADHRTRGKNAGNCTTVRCTLLIGVTGLAWSPADNTSIARSATHTVRSFRMLHPSAQNKGVMSNTDNMHHNTRDRHHEGRKGVVQEASPVCT